MNAGRPQIEQPVEAAERVRRKDRTGRYPGRLGRRRLPENIGYAVGNNPAGAGRRPARITGRLKVAREHDGRPPPPQFREIPPFEQIACWIVDPEHRSRGAGHQRNQLVTTVCDVKVCGLRHPIGDRTPLDAFMVHRRLAFIADTHAMPAAGQRLGQRQEGGFRPAKRPARHGLSVKRNAVVGHDDFSHQDLFSPEQAPVFRHNDPAIRSTASTVRLRIRLSVLRWSNSGAPTSLSYETSEDATAQWSPQGA